MPPATSSLPEHARLQARALRQSVCGGGGGSIGTSRCGSTSGTLGGSGDGVGTGSGSAGIVGVSGTIGVGASPGWGTSRAGIARAREMIMPRRYPNGVSSNRSRSSTIES